MLLKNKLPFWIALNSYVEMIVRGTSPLSLPDAIADSLSYVKAFGGTELLPKTYLDTVTLSGGCEQRNLPDNYIERQFIYMMDGSYLLTDIVPTSDMRIELDIQTTSITSEGHAWFGARNGSAGSGLCVGNDGTRKLFFDGCSGTRYTSSVTAVANTRYKYTWNNGVATIESGGSVVATNTFTPSDTISVPLIVNGLNSSGSVVLNNGGIYLYSFKAWNGQGELVMNLVPAVQRGTVPVVGFYDTVSKTFMTATSGTFAAGGEAVPAPDAPMDIVSNNGVLKVSKNLFDENDVILGYFYEDNGNYTSNANTFTSGKIPMNAGTTVTFSRSLSVSNVYLRIHAFNSNNEWIGLVAKSVSVSGLSVTGTTPANTSYVMVCGAKRIDSTEIDNECQLELGSTATQYMPYGQIYADGTVEQVTDSDGLTATAEMLLAVGDYKDTQEVLSGNVTRNIGIKVMTGDETFQVGTNGWISEDTITDNLNATYTPICTHFAGTDTTPTANSNTVRVYYTSQNIPRVYFGVDKTIYTSAEVFKQFLADQYNAGTPVIIIYPLATATTETVTPQVLEKEPITQTAGSISNLDVTAVSSIHTTPTPQKPLQINCNNGVLKYGNVSKNLFNEVYPNVSNSMKYLAIYLGPGKYTCSYSLPHMEGGTSMVYFLNGNVSSGASNNVNQVDASTSRTITTSTGYVTIAYRNGSGIALSDAVPTDYNCMVEQGQTATPYEPYRLAVYADGTVETINMHGKNLFDEQWNRNTGVSTQTATWGQVVTASGWSTSALIPVKTGQQYTFSYNTTSQIYVFYYESDGTMQQSYDTTSSTKKTFTVPAGATQIRLQVNKNTEAAIADLETQLETGATATDYEPYYNGGTATAEMLLKVDTYQDVQSILDGVVTRSVGVKVLDGTEDWGDYATANGYNLAISDMARQNYGIGLCSHLKRLTSVWEEGVRFGASNSTIYVCQVSLKYPNVTAFKQFLADQYNAGTPVIVIYPLAESTTESVTGQTLQVQAGNNILEIAQASMDGLELEASYKKGA